MVDLLKTKTRVWVKPSPKEDSAFRTLITKSEARINRFAEAPIKVVTSGERQSAVTYDRMPTRSEISVCERPNHETECYCRCAGALHGKDHGRFVAEMKQIFADRATITQKLCAEIATRLAHGADRGRAAPRPGPRRATARATAPAGRGKLHPKAR
jgi:hypothetical protein